MKSLYPETFVHIVRRRQGQQDSFCENSALSLDFMFINSLSHSQLMKVTHHVVLMYLGHWLVFIYCLRVLLVVLETKFPSGGFFL